MSLRHESRFWLSSMNFNPLPLFWSRLLMMKRWPYKWRSSEGRRTMPKGGCSKTPQQEEFSLSNDMVEKQTGKKVTLGSATFFFFSPPPPLPLFLFFLLFFLSSLLSSPLYLPPFSSSLPDSAPHAHLSSAYLLYLNRYKDWECLLAHSRVLCFLGLVFVGPLSAASSRESTVRWVEWESSDLAKEVLLCFKDVFIIWGRKLVFKS